MSHNRSILRGKILPNRCQLGAIHLGRPAKIRKFRPPLPRLSGFNNRIPLEITIDVRFSKTPPPPGKPDVLNGWPLTRLHKIVRDNKQWISGLIVQQMSPDGAYLRHRWFNFHAPVLKFLTLAWSACSDVVFAKYCLFFCVFCVF